MRKLVIVFLFFLMTAAVCIAKEKVKKIVVYKSPLETETPARIDCEDFFSRMQSHLDTYYFYKNYQINRILNDVKSSKEAPMYRHVDTRAKILIYYESGKIDTVCIGSTSIFYFHGKYMEFKNDNLSYFVDSLPYTHW